MIFHDPMSSHLSTHPSPQAQPLSLSCAPFLSEVAHTWTEGRLIHQNLVCITGICRGSVRELRNHKHFWMGGAFF